MLQEAWPRAGRRISIGVLTTEDADLGWPHEVSLTEAQPVLPRCTSAGYRPGKAAARQARELTALPVVEAARRAAVLYPPGLWPGVGYHHATPNRANHHHTHPIHRSYFLFGRITGRLEVLYLLWRLTVRSRCLRSLAAYASSGRGAR
jgi:hypothetical protein